MTNNNNNNVNNKITVIKVTMFEQPKVSRFVSHKRIYF